MSIAMPKSGLRKVAAVGALALASAGLSIATAGSAHAETGPTDYTCTVLGGAETFSANTDTDAPAKMAVGDKTKPLTVTSTVAIPGELAGLMYGFLGARTADGTAVADSTVNGVMSQTTLTVPTTTIPESGDLTVVASGTGKAIKAKKAGTLEIVAGDFVSTLHLYKEDGSEALVTEVPCAAEPKTIDTIKVAKGKTKTNASVKYAKAKKKFKIKAKVKAPVKATGKVKFKITKNGKKFKTVKARVNKRGVAKVNVKRIKKGKYVVKAKYTGNKNLKASRDRVKKRV